MLVRLEAEKEKQGQHPRSIAQIRRSNVPTLTGVTNSGDEDVSTSSTIISSEIAQPSHPTSLENLCSSEENSSEINIICSWAAPGKEGLTLGQHHLRQLAVRPEFKSKGCPILISAQYDPHFTHDFSKCPLVSCFFYTYIVAYIIINYQNNQYYFHSSLA